MAKSPKLPTPRDPKKSEHPSREDPIAKNRAPPFKKGSLPEKPRYAPKRPAD